jgi:hypothetical protein
MKENKDQIFLDLDLKIVDEVVFNAGELCQFRKNVVTQLIVGHVVGFTKHCFFEHDVFLFKG